MKFLNASVVLLSLFLLISCKNVEEKPFFDNTLPDYECYESGTYIVGNDIPADEYLLIAIENESATFELYRSNNEESYAPDIEMELVNRYFITLFDGDKIILNGCKCISSKQAPPYVLNEQDYPAGMYKVGYDINVDEWIIVTNKEDVYVTIYNDTKYEIFSISHHAMVQTRYYITLVPDTYIFINEGKIQKLDDRNNYSIYVKKTSSPEKYTYMQGMYKVGRDIKPGKYKVKCYWYKITEHNVIVTKGRMRLRYDIDTEESLEVSLYEGYYILLYGCYMKKIN